MKLTDKMASCSVTLEQNHPRSPCIQITRVSNKPSSPLHHICERPHLVPPDDSKREAIETMVCQKTESDQLLDTIPEETTEPSPAKDGNDNQTLRTSDAVICTKTESDHLLEPLPEGIADKWKPLFDKMFYAKHGKFADGTWKCFHETGLLRFRLHAFDVDGNGVISMEAFQVILYKYGLREDLDPHKREVLETTIEENTGGVISYQEFVNIMSDKRSLSFSIAVRSRYEECESDCIDGSNVGFKKDEYRNLTYQQRFLKMVADEILTNETDRNYFRCNFSWCLPPILIFLVSWIELGFYIGVTMNATRHDTNSTTRAEDIWTGPLPKNSWLVFDPDKRIQFWRFFSYILIHGGIEHILFNFSVQMFLGVPLEMVHGTRRIGTLYLISIAAGSMGTSVFDRRSYLVGASAGSYALLSAHLANVALHFADSKLSPQRIAVVIVCVSADFGLAVYRRYSGLRTAASFVAHLMGVTIGLTIGLFILKNYEQRLHERLGMWLAMVVYIVFILFVVFWNIFYKPGPAV